MDKLLNIIEIIDGKYVLNTNLLDSALTKTDNCNNIALISIIGPKSHGKTFLINCLINYMNSENKNEWPNSEDAFIKRDYWSQKDGDKNTPVIKLTSSPFIITDQIDDEVIRTALFLMDSDFVFDIEMSTQKVQDIIELFLLTSSTVIYNHKRYLPTQEFSRLKTISSRISYIDKSLDSLKNIVFLIRDWSPETRNNKFSHGLYDGPKYIENLIKNMNLDNSYEELNCFLMSAPELDTQTEVIKLSELNKQFSLDLKSLIDFKLLNIDEMPKKINPNTNQYINSSELLKLFEGCVEKLNRDKEFNLSADSLVAEVKNSKIGDKSKNETDSTKIKNDKEIVVSKCVFIERFSPTSESNSDNSFDITDDSKHVENSSVEPNEESYLNRTEKLNPPKIDFNDQIYDNESDSISCEESVEENSSDYRDDESLSIVSTYECLISEDESDISPSLERRSFEDYCNHEDIKDSFNPQMIENNVETAKTNSKKSIENNVTQINTNLMEYFNKEIKEKKRTSSFEYKSSPVTSKQFHQDLSMSYIHDSESYHHNGRENSHEMSKSFVDKTSETEIGNQFKPFESHYHSKSKNNYKISKSYPFECQSLTSIFEPLHQDIKRNSNHYKEDYDNERKNINEISEPFVEKNQTTEIEIENQFKDLVNDLLLEYNTNMEIKLKDQPLDLDQDLKDTHEILEQKIFGTFEKKSKDIKQLLIARDYRTKYYFKLNDKMNKAIQIYKNKVELKLDEARNQYQKVLRKIIGFYKMNMKSIIIDQMKDNLHTINLIHIQRICKGKAINTFKEETVKFFKGNFETEFLSKLNEEMDEINCNFEIACDHYRKYESRRQQIFSNLRYYSDDKIKGFHEIQKSRLNDSMQKLRDPDLIQYTFSLLDKSFNDFKERNKLIEEKERNFALRAIHLAFEIYKDCFEAKLKTGFYVQNELNNIRDQLLEYTIKQLIDSCDSNEYQNNLVEHCEDGLRLEVQAIHEIKSNEYRKKVDTTEKRLTKAREQALESYRNSMNAKLFTKPKKTSLKSNEFAALHHKYSKIAIECFNQSAKFLNQEFCPKFANKILLDNQSLLRNLITNEKQKLKTLNDKNIPDGHSIAIFLGKHYIIAATHRNNRYEIIPDKFDENLRPNSISFSNEILVGSEAKNHYETLYPDIVSFKNFDIKQLLGRERSLVLHEELSAFPFRFLRDKLSVYVDFHDFKTDLSIESLLAFMILNIKQGAEKQMGNMISNIVLTVPTNYTVVQKNAIRNAAKISGFEDCDLISEISAAAISYAVGRENYFNNIVDTVMFVIINDYECDVAICYIANEKIAYKKYYHQTLNSTEQEKRIFLQKIMKNSRKTEENINKITEYKFKELIEKVLKTSTFQHTVQIDECVIAGSSLLIPQIKIWIKKYINLIPSKICNSMDIIIKGSALYAEMLANKIKSIKISEVTTHNIYLNFESKFSKEKIIEVMHKNTHLPNDKNIDFNSLKSRDLPIKITVSQDKHLVTTHLINELPFSDYSDQGYKKHLINFDVDCFGDISIVSVLSKTKLTKGIKIEAIEINPGLNDQDIADEKQKFCSLINKIQEKIKINEEKLCLGKAIRELIHHCLNVKNEVENNLKLRPLIKKQILSEIEKTLNFLGCEHLVMNDIIKQRQMLDKTLEGYKSLLQ